QQRFLENSTEDLEHRHDVAADEGLAVASTVVEGPQVGRRRRAAEPIKADVRPNHRVRAVLPVGTDRDLVEAAGIAEAIGRQTTRSTARGVAQVATDAGAFLVAEPFRT